MAEVTHLCPPGDEADTPCCGRSVFELSRHDRLTNFEDHVTCDEFTPVPKPWVFHSQHRFTHMLNGGCPAYYTGTELRFCTLPRGHDTSLVGDPDKHAFHTDGEMKWNSLQAAQGRNDPSWHYLRIAAGSAPPTLRAELIMWADELEATDCEDPWKRCGKCRTCKPANGLEATQVIYDELDELLDMANRTGEGGSG